MTLWRSLRFDAAVLSVGWLAAGLRGALLALIACEALRLLARLIP